ncbi:MAG: helix-turn-helix transcriptional regulator [Saprospiraceae bacterium]|nr:helix-turn-helix transcriptional regulator [Saprospiraceae bacterium]
MFYEQRLHEIALEASVNQFDITELPPHPLLYPFIQSYTIIHNHDVNISTPWLILPESSTYLILHIIQTLDSTPIVRLSLIGPRSQFIQIDRKQRKLTILLRFRMGGAQAFFSKIMPELTDESVNIKELWHDEFLEYEEALLNAAKELSYWKCLEILEKILLKKLHLLKNTHPVITIFNKICQSNHEILTIAQIATQLGITERYLRKLVKDHTGLSPKSILKIERLTHSLKLWNRSPQPNWASIAAEAGYFDQSHMIDEYQSLIGRSPGKLLK